MGQLRPIPHPREPGARPIAAIGRALLTVKKWIDLSTFGSGGNFFLRRGKFLLGKSRFTEANFREILQNLGSPHDPGSAHAQVQRPQGGLSAENA